MREAAITVIVPAFDAERFLERAVRSVISAGGDDVQVAIVDDGSRDGTALFAEHLCRKFAGRCRLLRHPDGGNHGVSASRNLGIRSTESEWIAFLDADDFYLPNRFDTWRRATMSGQPGPDAIYEICEMRSDEAEGQEVALPDPDGLRLFGLRESKRGAALLAALLEGRCWAVSTITLRRRLLAKTGLFDEHKRIAEDCDLWFRVAAAGDVVAGDLANPVSVYWRHRDNTYRYEFCHRPAMLRAMLDTWHWARHANLAPEVLATFPAAVRRYATRSIVAAREAGEPAVARRLLRLMASRMQFGFLLRFETLRQVVPLIRDWSKTSTPSNRIAGDSQ